MTKKFKNILLVYKKSAYSIYFMERKMKLESGKKENIRKELQRFKKAHDEHYATLRTVERVLAKYQVKYTKRGRGSLIHYPRYDLIITLGGDGTFLEATRTIKDQVVIGVNSSPSYSVGKLCVGNASNFEQIIRLLIDGKYNIELWSKLRLRLEGNKRILDCVNDVLICHSNPAAMSRYRLKIGSIKEEHRNSGIWVSTPTGSSGGIKSAGGKILKSDAKKLQYMPRELYFGFNPSYRLKGGILSSRQSITITSLMRSGMIYIDGTHYQLKFPFNSTLKVSLSPQRLHTIRLK